MIHFISPFPCRWTLGLLSPLGYCAVMSFCFHFFRDIPRSGYILSFKSDSEWPSLPLGLQEHAPSVHFSYPLHPWSQPRGQGSIYILTLRWCVDKPHHNLQILYTHAGEKTCILKSQEQVLGTRPWGKSRRWDEGPLQASLGELSTTQAAMPGQVSIHISSGSPCLTAEQSCFPSPG